MPQKYYLYESDKPNKKFYIEYVNPDSGRLRKIYFGASGYNDYTLFPKNERDSRKERYLKRHQKEDNTNPTKPSFYATNLLWNLPTLNASIKDTNKRFGIKIIKKF